MLSKEEEWMTDSMKNTTDTVATDYTGLYNVDKTSFLKTFNFLTSQKNELVEINSRIIKEKETSNTSDYSKFVYLHSVTESIINSDFGGVFLLSSNTIPELQNIINNKENSAIIVSIASSVLAVSLRLSKIFSLVACTIPTVSCTISPEMVISPRKPSNVGEELVLCRICEELIPKDLIEIHSKSCVMAYESEFNLITTDEKIKKLQKTIRSSVLNGEWPGTAEHTVSIELPMLHVLMLLDASIQGDEQQLTDISSALMKVKIEDPSPTIQDLLAKAKELMAEKVRAATALNQATAVLKETSLSGSNSRAPSLQTRISEFSFIKRISSGAFAKVFLATKVRTGDIYAIKVIPKGSQKQKNQIKQLITEKDILLRNLNPYIVDFYYSIIGEHNLYLIMEYLPGGDLFSLLDNIGSLEESDAKTYTIQIIKALEYLHSQGIIHRDIKPDNMIIDVNGKLKLTDFGLSLYGAYDRSIPEDEKRIVGTPDYLAPEIILSRQHSFTADYWSLGCVIYEFLTGEPPFHRSTESETFAQILSGKADYSLLSNVSDECIDLIKKLLTIDPTKRIGAGGIQEIMNHKWFVGVDWDHVEDLEPVFLPENTDEQSVSYFVDRYKFEKTDEIEKDILEDIEMSKNQIPQSVSMTDISSRNSFSSWVSSDDDFDDLDDEEGLLKFPSVNLTKLKDKTIGHRRSRSFCPDEDLGNLTLCVSRSCTSLLDPSSESLHLWNTEDSCEYEESKYEENHQCESPLKYFSHCASQENILYSNGSDDTF